METPEFHNGIAPGANDAVYRIREITAWFKHVNSVTPRLRRLRLDAIAHLRGENLTIPEISIRCQMNETRIHEILKEERHRSLLRGDSHTEHTEGHSTSSVVPMTRSSDRLELEDELASGVEGL